MQLTKRFGAGFMIVLMNVNMFQAAAAQGTMKNSVGNPQLMRDIQVLDSLTTEFNSKSAKDNKRVENIVASFEKLMGRKLASEEKGFLSLQFAAMESLPRFEVKGNSIQVYDNEGSGKDLLASVEVIDAEKNIFKYGNRTFQVDPAKPLHENVQLILKEFQRGDGFGFWQQFSPIPQAHAEMAPWLKLFLVGAVALVAGIFIGKAIQKNKDKKNSQIAEANESSGSSDDNDIAEADDSDDASHDTVSSDAPTQVEMPTTGAEPSLV